MPLSDHEQKILSEIERHLVADDPTLATQIGRTSTAIHLARLRQGILIALLGLGALVGFFVTRLLLLGVAAFALMVAGSFVASLAVRGLWGSRMSQERDPRALLQGFFATWPEGLRERFRRR